MKTEPFRIIFIPLLVVWLALPLNEVQADPPRWAPAHGYRAQTRQIYFPDQNFYFDIQRNVYIYFYNGKWITNTKLPTVYARVNLSLAPKVELEIATNEPYRYNKTHVTMYKSKKVKAGKPNQAKPFKRNDKRK